MKNALRFAGWLALALAAIFLAIQLSFLVRVWWWRDHNPQSTAFMEASLERLRARKADANLSQVWVPYARFRCGEMRA